MRLLPILSGFMLLSAAAVAQPAPDAAPLASPPLSGQDQSAPPPPEQQAPPPEQSAPPPGQPTPPAPGAHMNFAQRFRAANTTGDGHLTLDQAQAGGLVGVARHFQQIDADHKGYVTFQDINAWRMAMRQARHAPPQ